jgi:hypothetical protein
MAHDWYQLVYTEENELDMKSEDEQEWHRIQDNENEEVSISRTKEELKEADENEEDTVDLKFENGDIDIGDDEGLFDETGKSIVIEEMALGLQQIIDKYMKKLNRKLAVYEQILMEKSDTEQ